MKLHISRRTLVSLLTLVIALLSLFYKSSHPSNPPNSSVPSEFLVSRVIDGDTIELSNGQRVRYIGIDTPETVDPRRAVGCFGKQASQYNNQLVGGKLVRLEKDVSETDKYGRLLRYVYVGDDFVNLRLVAEGYATAASYPPDISKQDLFRQAESTARSQGRGLWSACPR